MVWPRARGWCRSSGAHLASQDSLKQPASHPNDPPQGGALIRMVPERAGHSIELQVGGCAVSFRRVLLLLRGGARGSSNSRQLQVRVCRRPRCDVFKLAGSGPSVKLQACSHVSDTVCSSGLPRLIPWLCGMPNASGRHSEVRVALLAAGRGTSRLPPARLGWVVEEGRRSNTHYTTWAANSG